MFEEEEEWRIWEKAQSSPWGLFKRSDQGDTPYNLRNCAYVGEFVKEKIVYPETTQDNSFCFENEGLFVDKTAFFFQSNSIKFLLSIFSSQFFKKVYRKYFSSIELGKKAFQYNKHALESFPVPQISKEQQKPFEKLVDYILLLKEKDIYPLFFIQCFETVINSLVYDLYFEEETKAHNLYVSDFVPKYLVSLKPEMTDDEKIQICEKMYLALKK